MALFGSNAAATPLAKVVRPTVVRTQNVSKELFNIAKSYDIQPETLDFNILDVQTFVRLDEGEWESIDNSKLYELDDQTQLLNPHFSIKQTYEIEIFSKNRDALTLCKNMKISVGANASKCKVYLSIAAGSSVSFDPMLEQGLLLEIKKRKMRAGILVDIFDEMVESVAAKIAARAQVGERLEFVKNETFLIAESHEPTSTTNDALILHYEKNQDIDENERIDYAARGFIQAVKQDELLIEYIKAKNGLPGRNCRGEFMKPEEPRVLHQVAFSVDDTIRVEEDDYSIRYYAADKGYIAFENNIYTVKKEVDVGEISFKTTGSIRSGVDSDVNVNVSESNVLKDAIGTGMHVEVSEIEVDGNVGPNAKVIAKKATIGGQTHATAFVQADELDINIHKGKASGINVHVTRVEHGEVEAEILKVSQALGGSLRAKEIDIELCASHVKASATRRIEIKKMQGSENIFTIDPLINKNTSSGVKDNKEQIALLEKEIKELKTDFTRASRLIEDGTPAFKEIKKRLLHYKAKGVKMPESFVKKYKEFQALQAKHKDLEEQIAKKSDQLTLYSTRTSSFQDNIFDARVINRDRWIGYNEIRFKLVEPPMELVYKPREGSSEKVFGVVDLGDGEFEIQALKEEKERRAI